MGDYFGDYRARWEPGLCGATTAVGFVCTRSIGHEAEDGRRNQDPTHYHHKSGTVFFDDEVVGVQHNAAPAPENGANP